MYLRMPYIIELRTISYIYILCIMQHYYFLFFFYYILISYFYYLIYLKDY